MSILQPYRRFPGLVDTASARSVSMPGQRSRGSSSEPDRSQSVAHKPWHVRPVNKDEGLSRRLTQGIRVQIHKQNIRIQASVLPLMTREMASAHLQRAGFSCPFTK